MIHERVILTRCYADVAELADAPDLGSGVPDVQVQVLSSAGLETFHLNFIRVKGLFLFVLHLGGCIDENEK